jgi:hypothetical protein
MILNHLRKLQVVLTTAKTTSDMSVLVDYADDVGSSSQDGMQISATNGTTSADVCFAPSEGVKRTIKGIQINNIDTASKIIHLSLVDSSTSHRLVSATLQVGDTLGYTDASGWYVIDTSGSHKSSVSTATTIDTVDVNAGSSGVAGTVDIFPATAAKGKVQFTKADNTGDTVTGVSFDAMGQATAIHFGDLGAASDYVVRSTAQITLAEADVLDGATLGGNVASKAKVNDTNANQGIAKVTEFHIGVSGSETQVTATGLEINRVADVSTRLVAAGATLAVTVAAHDGKTIQLDAAGGSVCTLPVASATGARVRFAVTVRPASGSHVIKVGNASDFIAGQINMLDLDASAQGAFQGDGAADDTITINNTTTGGAIGDYIELEDTLANVWTVVHGALTVPVGSNIADPFSATV